MSNARSPRDVCSTTIGTRGLMVLAVFSLSRLVSCRRDHSEVSSRSWRRVYQPPLAARQGSGRRRAWAPGAGKWSAAGRPQPPSGRGGLGLVAAARVAGTGLVRGPQALARAGLLDRDRLGLARDQLERSVSSEI